MKRCTMHSGLAGDLEVPNPWIVDRGSWKVPGEGDVHVPQQRGKEVLRYCGIAKTGCTMFQYKGGEEASAEAQREDNLGQGNGDRGIL
jgi:hypothetical protein